MRGGRAGAASCPTAPWPCWTTSPGTGKRRWPAGFEFLRIPSVSAQPAHAAHCEQAVEWARDRLAGMSFAAGLRATAGHPVVLAHHPGPGPDAPHLLYYGHCDVQPAPLDLWDGL